MYAITPKGIGRSVGCRRIKDGWPLAEHESFTVKTLPENPVLADDGVSLRSATDADVKVMQTQSWRESTKVGPLQLRRALREIGEMQTIRDYMDNTADEETQEAWKFATVIPRLDPLVEGIKDVLGKTDAEVDQLFEIALIK